MIHPDVARAATQMSVWWRARVLCVSAEPHGATRPPCAKHEDEAHRQLRARLDPPPAVRARPGSVL